MLLFFLMAWTCLMMTFLLYLFFDLDKAVVPSVPVGDTLVEMSDAVVDGVDVDAHDACAAGRWPLFFGVHSDKEIRG
jgi:hypothetical protein